MDARGFNFGDYLLHRNDSAVFYRKFALCNTSNYAGKHLQLLILLLSKIKKIGVAVAISLVLVATAFFFYTFDPEKVVLFPKCPFLLTTGYECPGCGSQRALHSILHLNFKSAFSHNALILFLIPYILFGAYLEFFNGKNRFPKLEKFFFGKWAAIIVVSVIIVYWVVRNLN